MYFKHEESCFTPAILPSPQTIQFQLFPLNTARSRSRIVFSGDVFTSLLMTVPLRGMRLTYPEVMMSLSPELVS
jgi:hypothetical protein